MPTTTPNLALPIPTGTDGPDGPGAVSALANAIDARAGSGVLALPGSVINIDSAQPSRWTQHGRAVTVNFAVNVGSGGLSNSTGQLFASAPQPFTTLAVWGTMNVHAADGSFVGIGSFQIPSDGGLRHFAWAPAGSGPSNSIPANYRLTGHITYEVN